MLLALKRDDEALTNLVEVTKRDGARYPISYYHLARLYERRGELKLAEAAFAQAAALHKPTNAQFILDLSRVREKLGDFKGSLEAMESYSEGDAGAGTKTRLVRRSPRRPPIESHKAALSHKKAKSHIKEEFQVRQFLLARSPSTLMCFLCLFVAQ